MMLFKIITQVKYKLFYALVKNKSGCIYKKAGVDYRDESQMASIIADALRWKKPLCIGKIGGNEATVMKSYYLGTAKQIKLAFDRLCHFAGFFPNEYTEEDIRGYVEVQSDAISELDMIIDYEKEFEDYLLKKCGGVKKVWVDRIGSWNQDIPWTRELAGYRVVVVHPYAELIESQYKRRAEIYKGTDVLPEFELRVIKAVQTIADTPDSRFGNWFEALDWMYQEVMKEDFDIALVGCGAYGLPLAAKIKEAGKIGVHMGGDLQMLFGIRGKRWDDRERACRWYNDSWVRPGDEYRVSGFDTIEDGCYW